MVGATLNTGTKTKAPVDYAAAKQIYDKLIKSKTAEGYVPGAESGPYVHTDADARATGVQPQLLNFIEEAEALALRQDDDWWAQEKFDGKRMLLRKAEAQSPMVIVINRSGITIGAPDTILQCATAVAHCFLLDGEAVGETLFAFDLLEFQDKAMPAPNSVVEVRYLYAYPGGSLYQPTYLGVRDDIGADDCGIDQLKYKQAG